MLIPAFALGVGTGNYLDAQRHALMQGLNVQFMWMAWSEELRITFHKSI